MIMQSADAGVSDGNAIPVPVVTDANAAATSSGVALSTPLIATMKTSR